MHAWINITHPGFSGRQEMPDDGDQWVSWEQMVATLRAKGEAEGRAALLAREVVELRGEVAKFKPLEMILAKGGDPVQHLSEAVLDLSAKLRSAEDAIRIMDREYFGLNNRLREARAEIDLLKETAQASAVVVPELTDDEMLARYDNDKVGLFSACIDKTCKANWWDTRKKLLDALANQGGAATC